MGLSFVFYGALEAAGKTLCLFLFLSSKKPQPFMYKSDLQSKEEKSIIIEIPYMSKIRFL